MHNQYLTPEMYQEAEAAIANLNPRKLSKDQIKLLFRVLLSGAFRVSEVLELVPSDILKNGMIRLRKTKTGWQTCKCSKWAARPRRLIQSNPNCDKCKGVGKYRIDQYGWTTEEVFHDLKVLALTVPEGRRLFPITRRQVLNYAHQIASCGTHAFRHSWLTWLAAKDDLNIEEMRTKSRHTTVGTLQIYLHANADLVRLKEQQNMTIPGTKDNKDEVI